MNLHPRFTTREFWADHKPYEPGSKPAARLLVKQVVEMTSVSTRLSEGSSVLEVGAGNGALSVALGERFQLVALDLSEGLLRANPADRRVEADVFHLPFAADAFELVIATALLHHLTDVRGALAEMRRVSKSYVAALEPNRNNPLLAAYGFVKPEERGLLPFTATWLARQARAADLAIDACFPFGWISPNKTPTFLLPLIARLPLRHPFGLDLLLVAHK